MHKQPIIIGLIGGVASGKSTVARWLQSYGALWLEADGLAHEVLNWPETQAELRAEFGNEIFAADQSVDRQQLGKLVFGNTEPTKVRRARLESMIHPRVRRLTQERIDNEGANYPAVVIDAPLLIEAGWSECCDRILLVDAPLELRQQLAAQRGWSSDELQRREAAQLALNVKREQATDIIKNSGSEQQLAIEVQKFWESLRSAFFV